MAKAANPMDAHRKSLRKKELTKNKTNRKNAKEIAVVKKDTRSLESDIRKLSSTAQLNSQDKAELVKLREELSSIQKAKAEYVEAHPEHRKFVYREDGNSTASTSARPIQSTSGLYGADGKLRNPERSVYYDPVFNPFGAPPPGMPYREKPPTPEEMAAFQPHVSVPETAVEEEESEEEEDDDDDIEMPSGPPPDSDDSDDDDDDDIAMPTGPPPIRYDNIPTGPSSSRVSISRPQFAPQQQRHYPQPMHPVPQMRSGHFQPRSYLPPPPQAMQSPLPSHRPPPSFHPGMSSSIGPQFPPTPAAPTPAVVLHNFAGIPSALPGAIISAAPQLRDFKAEVVAFVPNVVKRKKVNNLPGLAKSINAAPPAAAAVSSSSSDSIAVTSYDQSEKREVRPSLMGALKDVGVLREKVAKKDKDYDQFLSDMQGLL